MNGNHNMFETIHDLRASIRSLRHRPLYALVAVGILALGLSAGIAVFTYINGFYQPFPGVNSDGLVRVFAVEEENPYRNISYPDYEDYAAGANETFEGIAAIQASFAASVRLETAADVVFGQAVTGNYFAVLDVAMSVGRGLTGVDNRADADPAVVISHGYWRRRFHGEPSAIGSVVYLNSKPFTVVGVAGPEFLGSSSSLRPEVWMPLEQFKLTYTGWAASSQNRDIPLMRVYARLHDGVRVEQAQAELQALAVGLDDVYPAREEPRRMRVDAAAWIDPTARLAESTTVRLMLAAAGGLLLLVCANVANLLLSVATGRRREMAMRAALGASPGRLLRQVLAENVLLSALAGGVALVIAAPAAARLGSYFARPSVWGANVPREASIDFNVILFALAVSVLTGLIAGVLPALRTSRRNLVGTLKVDADVPAEGRGRLLGRRTPGVRDLLVSTQVALSVVLLVVAGLVLRTLNSVGNLDPGFSYDNLIASYASTSSAGVEIEDRERFFRELTELLNEQPWVQAATVADNAPLSPHASTALRFDGHNEPVSLVYSRVRPGFFETLEIEVLRGRTFAATDTVYARGVAVINETLARQYFDGEDPLDRRIWWLQQGGEERSFEIVGVVRDAKARNFLAEPEAMVYFSYPQHYHTPGNAILVATTIDPGLAVSYLYRELREFETHIAIVNALPYTEVVSGFTYTQRMNAELFSVLAFLGVALAAVGIFSVMSLAVQQRTREIGIRMAVGATGGHIARLVMGRAMGAVGLGIVVGLAATVAVTRLIRSLLYGVETTDPIAFAAGVAVLVASALLATYLPARRAVAVDPLTSLRGE